MSQTEVKGKGELEYYRNTKVRKPQAESKIIFPPYGERKKRGTEGGLSSPDASIIKEEIHLSRTALLELLKGRSINVGKDKIVKGYGLDRTFEYGGKQ